MAKCEEGYRCDVCGQDVEGLEESELYLRFVIGEIDPEILHTHPERHIRCNPALAQFIEHPDFVPVACGEPFSKELLDSAFVAQRTAVVTAGWQRLLELRTSDLPIHQYPLPSFRARYQDPNAADDAPG